MKLKILLALFTDACFQTFARRIDKLSFSPPFENHDRSGNRIVNQNWAVDGVTKVANNFIRLTPDRASKKGSLWSKSPIDYSEVVAIVEFRISGKTKRLYGDGLALWFVEPYATHDLVWNDDFYYGAYLDEDELNPFHSWNEWPLGSFHAFEPKFKGFGVIFDTYYNRDMPKHYDVTVVVNDRNITSISALLENATGCNSNVRWDEGRDDFHAGKASSLVQISILDDTLHVRVDADGSNKWFECSKMKLPFESGWLQKAHVGATASTGDLADNHDLIRIAIYSDEESASLMESDLLSRSSKSIAVGSLEAKSEVSDKRSDPDGGTLEERVLRMETFLNVLLVKLDLVQHHMEHELISLEQTTTESAFALKAQESLLELHLRELSVKVSDAENRLQSIVKNGISTAEKRAQGWRIPVIIFALFLVCCACAFSIGWRRLRKSHLL